MRLFQVLAAAAVGLALATSTPVRAAIPEYGYKVVHAYPHDKTAFTEGLFYLNGYLYESTGSGQSYFRKARLETGEVVQTRSIAPQLFGEGIVAWKDRLYELTWQTQVGFIYDLKTFAPLGEFHYPGEGWALTHDEHRLIMSDGTPELRFLDPVTLKEQGRLKVTADGQPVRNLNELEYVHGQIYANIWMTNRIACIDPKTGVVKAWIDLSGLKPRDTPPSEDAVLNGIAYDAKGDRLFVTGKMWPKLFEIKLVKHTSGAGRAGRG